MLCGVHAARMHVSAPWSAQQRRVFLGWATQASFGVTLVLTRLFLQVQAVLCMSRLGAGSACLDTAMRGVTVLFPLLFFDSCSSQPAQQLDQV